MTDRFEPQSDPWEPGDDAPSGEHSGSARTISLKTILWGAILVAAFAVLPWAAGGSAPWNDRSGITAASALEEVAGDAAALRVGDDCGDHAVACVIGSEPVVIVPPRFAELTDVDMLADGYRSWIDIMRHEYMHILQHRLGSQLAEDPNFLDVFDNVPNDADDYESVRSWAMELSAECMAETEYTDYRRTYPGSCDDGQQRFAQTILAQARAME